MLLMFFLFFTQNVLHYTREYFHALLFCVQLQITIIAIISVARSNPFDRI